MRRVGFTLGLTGISVHAGAAWASTAATVIESGAQGSPWSFTLGTAGPVSIPTLDQWGRITLAVFMAALAFKYLGRRRGPAALTLTAMVILWSGLVSGAPEKWPFSTAGHNPTASISATMASGQPTATLTMRYPPSPTAGQTSVLVVSRLAVAANINVTSVKLHYQKAGDGGTWQVRDGASWGAPGCSDCWTASLPLNGYVANDQIRYYMSAVTDSGTPYYFFPSSSPCAGVTCSNNSTCVDGYCLSSICDAGYFRNGLVCTPINACATSNGGCHAHATCTFTGPGTNSCACNAGYSGNGQTCDATNSCLTNNGGCDTHAQCTSTGPGTNTCACHSGYSGNGAVCTSIDSCTISHGGCDANASCTSTGPGTNSCACMEGYTGNGETCIGSNACAINNGGCAATAQCTSDNPDTHSCACNSGYIGDGTVCDPINSCATNSGGCDAHATCASTGPGTNTCTCNSGYQGNGQTCSEVNSCATNNGGCGDHYLCTITGPGTNSCACLSNWSGASCDSCASGYYGAACNACPDCGDHGTCDDGLAGSGTCACEPDYLGADCHSCSLLHLPNGDCVNNCTDTPGYPYMFGLECVAECPTGYTTTIADICISDADTDPVIEITPPNQ